MKSNENVYSVWFKMMDNIANSWKGSHEKTEEGQYNAGDFARMTDKWLHSYQEATAKMWEPFLHQAQENSMNYFYLYFLNPAFSKSYTEQSNAIRKILDQFSSTRYSMFEDLINASRSLMSVFENSAPSLENLTKIYPHTISGWYTEIFKASQKNMFPLLQNFPDMKTIDWQYNDKTMDYIIRYYNKSMRMQYLMASKATSAWEKVLKEMNANAKDGKPVFSFNEFYTLWSQLNEKEFEDLFHTKEFVMLQEELLRVKSELIKRFEKIAENIIQPWPLVSKSQMVEVYEMNHDLRKRIGKLEKQMAN